MTVCRVNGCGRQLKAQGLCHVHLKDMSKPRTLSIGTSDFSKWQKQQNLERSWRKEATSDDRHARARRKRTEAIALATPVWLSPAHHSEMNAMYARAQELSKKTGVPWEVDHIIPLHGEGVSGLHVPWNMRVVEKSENNKKGNREYEV
jgi:5-methylcytosine-specific restriction endonuclease McrA